MIEGNTDIFRTKKRHRTKLMFLMFNPVVHNQLSFFIQPQC